MEGESQERQTRNSKRLSGAKRKRADSNDDTPQSQSKKKMPDTIAEQIESLKVFFTKELESNRKEITASNNEAIGAVSKRIDQTQRDLDLHKSKVEAELKRLSECIDGAGKSTGTPGRSGQLSYAGALGSAKNAAAADAGLTAGNMDQYWRAQASARLSPVPGDGEKELWENLQKFLHEMMRIPYTELTEKDVQLVRRVRVARGKKSRLEVVVKFVDVETRDHVASYARNLGDYIVDGKPTATFRHEIPTFLSGVHKTALQWQANTEKSSEETFVSMTSLTLSAWILRCQSRPNGSRSRTRRPLPTCRRAEGQQKLRAATSCQAEMKLPSSSPKPPWELLARAPPILSAGWGPSQADQAATARAQAAQPLHPTAPKPGGATCRATEPANRLGERKTEERQAERKNRL